MIEVRHLRVLRAVARGGSFSAAARALGCTQPAVSQQMKALEQAAGTPLLVRGPRQTRLTEAGEALVRHADGILAGLTAAEEEIAAIAGLRAGRVRLASFPSGTATLVPGAVAEMRAAYPGTEVSLVEAQPPRSVEMLRAEYEQSVAAGKPFSGFTANGSFGGKEVVYYQEVLPETTVEWYTLYRGQYKVSVGCKYAPAGKDVVRRACERVVRTLAVG